MIKMISSFCLALISLFAVAQVSTVSPQKPSPQQTIRLTYNRSDPRSAFNINEPLFVRLTGYKADGGIEKYHIQLTGDSSEISNSFTLPKNAASLKVEFYSINKDDEEATKTLMIYEKDSGIPVTGAFLEAMFNNEPDSVFQKEIKNHPDNYLAYANFFNIISMVKESAAAKLRINQLLPTLERAGAKQMNAGLLAALCVGKAKTGELLTAKTYLIRMLRDYPVAEETAFAFSIYNYEYFKASNKPIEDDVKKQVASLFINYPLAPLSGDPNMFYYLQRDEAISTSAFEQSFIPRLQRDEIGYHALSNLANLYIDRGYKLDSAEKMLSDAIKRFQNGTINHQHRLNYNHYQMYVPVMLMGLTKINMAKKNYEKAIINASAALQLISGSNTEGNFAPLLLQLRATSYHLFGNANLAMEDYKKLYLTGSTSAVDSMRVIFTQCTLKQKSFDEFITSLKPAKVEGGTNNLNMAPDFTGTDLSGKKVTLSNLKGKLVIINLWAIGCGPCVAEMPELNALVKHYQPRKDVVFLAVTADKTKDLVSFFKVEKFNYTVLNNAGNVGQKYNTNALPVHIVIGKQGEILSRSVGSRPDIKAYLKGVIDANL